MFLLKKKDFEWSQAGYDGGFRSILRTSKEGGKTSIVKLKKDTVAPTHYHAAGEDVLVLSGSVKIGDFIFICLLVNFYFSISIYSFLFMNIFKY